MLSTMLFQNCYINNCFHKRQMSLDGAKTLKLLCSLGEQQFRKWNVGRHYVMQLLLPFN